MKPELSESLFVENLFNRSQKDLKVPNEDILAINKLSGDASTRRYYRLETIKSSYVVCLDNPTVLPKDEYPFYSIQQFLSKNNIRVPKILDMDLAKGYLLEEDLGDRTLLAHLANVVNIKEEHGIYTRCLDIIINMHQSDTSIAKNLPFTKLAFDSEKYMYEFEFTIDYFISRLLKKKLSRKDKIFLVSSFNHISEELASYPMVPTHRDYHSRNLMVKNDELIVIDFQDARMGIPQYDLVSLLEDCYYAVHIDNKKTLIDYYWKNANIQGQKDFETFMRLYDLMTIQRVFKAIGSFAYIFHYRHDERYLRHIGFAMEVLKGKLQKYPELHELKKLLFTIYYES